MPFTASVFRWFLAPISFSRAAKKHHTYMAPAQRATLLARSRSEKIGWRADPPLCITTIESNNPLHSRNGHGHQSYGEMGLGNDLEQIAAEMSQEMSAQFPNDLTRVIYLASLRDYNTGRYLHPRFSFDHEPGLASDALRECHEMAFARLLGSSVLEYVCQLKAYIRLSKATPLELIRIWKDLRVYTAAIPLHKQDLDRDTFLLSLETALLVLENDESTTFKQC